MHNIIDYLNFIVSLSGYLYITYAGNMVQFLHDILLNELKSYLSKRPIKRKSKQHLETVEIDKSTIEKLVENSQFSPEAKGIKYSNYECMETTETLSRGQDCAKCSPTNTQFSSVSDYVPLQGCKEDQAKALRRMIKSSTKPLDLDSASTSSNCSSECERKRLQEWGQVVWCKCRIDNLPWRFDSSEKIRFRMSPDEKWNNTVFKTPTMILVATLLSNTEMVEKRTDSFVKRVLKDKDFDVVAIISGDNYQYPVMSNTTKSNHHN